MSDVPISPIVALAAVVLMMVALVVLVVTNAWSNFWWSVGNTTNYFGVGATPYTSGGGYNLLTSIVYAMSRNPAGDLVAFLVLSVIGFAIYYLAGEGSESQEYYYGD